MPFTLAAVLARISSSSIPWHQPNWAVGYPLTTLAFGTYVVLSNSASHTCRPRRRRTHSHVPPGALFSHIKKQKRTHAHVGDGDLEKVCNSEEENPQKLGGGGEGIKNLFAQMIRQRAKHSDLFMHAMLNAIPLFLVYKNQTPYKNSVSPSPHVRPSSFGE